MNPPTLDKYVEAISQSNLSLSDINILSIIYEDIFPQGIYPSHNLSGNKFFQRPHTDINSEKYIDNGLVIVMPFNKISIDTKDRTML